MKMYVVLMNYDNGLWDEDKEMEQGVFCGIFSTCERAKKMVAAFCNQGMTYLRLRFQVLKDSIIRTITETPNIPGVVTRTTMRFETYGGAGYVSYAIVEREVDSEIGRCRLFAGV